MKFNLKNRALRRLNRVRMRLSDEDPSKFVYMQGYIHGAKKVINEILGNDEFWGPFDIIVEIKGLGDEKNEG